MESVTENEGRNTKNELLNT
ncbi:Protein of unknown function [Bacillus cereus]|uniref:Uncharacterized protein n=2 Tax=Bacillus cereus group TaxID=86661 RepID=A0A1C4D6N2_BACTU|nr:Protein of unknown function [Bacillus thuringiensis]SCC29844.1 Protein of unknown function [Bacillus cereus]SCC36948.1 Protein of unknown function [Bacillus wiedmannii]SCL94569.1 Protein of unknown function [Bacillus wiedmannii]SCM96005.1 Protein of unknown function [Bacillus cereus]